METGDEDSGQYDLLVLDLIRVLGTGRDWMTVLEI